MKAIRPRAMTGAAILTVLVSLLAGCGDGTVTFGNNDGNDAAKVTFTGTLDSVSPVTSRDIVVFVYSIKDHGDRCPCPPDPSSQTVGKAAVLPSGETEFTIAGLEPGAFGVVFLLDEAGNQADGQIDPGDPIAILDDIDCELDDVAANMTVTLEDVDILFSSTPVDACSIGDPPAAGRARANRITQKTTPPAK